MARGKAKGSQWERVVCGRLSEWFSKGKYDDLFWRSASSGGRSTNRSKRGMRTTGHAGDIAATSPSGYPLTRLLTIEIKRGYSSRTIADLLDRANGCAQQLYEAWIQQAAEAQKVAGSYSWMIIAQRDRRIPIVIFERKMMRALARHGAFQRDPFVLLRMETMLRFQNSDNATDYRFVRIVAMGFEDWMKLVPPSAILRLDKEIRGRNRT